ncbi:unnamed protein product [[Candida] boidinii]|uniref:Unnamed protein product n=1 Tax=Candida boidinii TaxID=5477 RepID=A0A9W6WIS3_CANBO|nr:hypothetical protein B5S30_g1582 [[Candida] boidinii]OWB84970.1 hypothetical protein B5S33_g3627 [[Candida] boidinii]GME74159.1 unnamed protein product [[Candida] boidinii]GMF99130.1 unnamed protein product [[Candida] boidinii]
MTQTKITFSPLKNEPLGATVTLPEGVTDPAELDQLNFQLLKEALHKYLVLVIPNQEGLKPQSQYVLTQRFDDSSHGLYGHDEKLFHHDKSVLAKDGKCIPERPEVICVGNGKFEAQELTGNKDMELEHPTHFTFHKNILTDEEVAQKQTRYYRWHIDSALYDLAPPMVTTLLGLVVPENTEKQIIKYTDSDESKEVVKGATAFVSGANSFKQLSKEDQDFAMNTTVVYAPHPYIFIAPSKATDDGLTMVSEGKETQLGDLPEWDMKKVKKLPLVWSNPTTGEPHLQVHGCCIWKLVNSKSGETICELEEAREKIHSLMRPGMSPELVYCHPWKKGDLAIFFNRGVWHSVTGEFAEDEKRLMHQCNIASGLDPVCIPAN